ncbi:MAG TPA: hypothetical protein DCP98_02930 [Sphaerochaeta sp.]|nr:hypothetical protein [Sphaerochaeta sp.]
MFELLEIFLILNYFLERSIHRFLIVFQIGCIIVFADSIEFLDKKIYRKCYNSLGKFRINVSKTNRKNICRIIDIYRKSFI